jgi:hypothetical protein
MADKIMADKIMADKIMADKITHPTTLSTIPTTAW